MSKFAELKEAQAEAADRQEKEERKVADFCNGVAAMFEKYLGGSGAVAFTGHEVSQTEERHVQVTQPPYRREGSQLKTSLLFDVNRTTVVVPFTLVYDAQANVLRATAGKDGRKQFDMGTDGRPIAEWLVAEVKAYFKGANFLPALVIL